VNYCPKVRKIAQGGIELKPMKAIPKGFLANKVQRIHGEHVVDVVSGTGSSKSKGWLVGGWGISPNLAKSPFGLRAPST
jgi:hypothetical protein